MNYYEWVTDSYATATITDGLIEFKNTRSYYGHFYYPQLINIPYSVELEYVETSGGNFTFGIGITNLNNAEYPIYYSKTNNNYWAYFGELYTSRPNTGDIIKLEVTNTSIKFYNNNVLLNETNNLSNVLPSTFTLIGTDYPRTQHWKNIIIKKL